MNNKNEILFDALLQIATSDAMDHEIESMPSCEALNEQYAASALLDCRVDTAIKKYQRKIKGKEVVKKIGKISAVAAIIVIFLCVTLMSVNFTRKIILNAVNQFKDKYAQIRIDNPCSNIKLYLPAFIPNGYKEISKKTNTHSHIIVYQNNEGKQITFHQIHGDIDSINKEHMICEEVKVSGRTAYWYVNGDNSNDTSILLWHSYGCVFELTSESGIDMKTMIKMAESLKSN